MDNKVKLVRFAPLSLRKSVDDRDVALQWSIRMGYPRITIYTDTSVVNQDGKMDFSKIIIAPFDYVNLKVFLEYFKKVINGENDNSYSVNCYNVKFKDGVKTNETYLQAKVVVGKDKEGIIYLAAIEEGKPKIKFELLPNTKWFRYFNKDDIEIDDKGTLSKLYSTSYVCLLETIIQKEFNIDVKEEVMLDPPSFSNVKPKEEEKVTVVPVGEAKQDGLAALDALL